MSIFKKTVSLVFSAILVLSMLAISITCVSADSSVKVNDVMLGDVNNDKSIDMNDVLVVQRHIAAYVDLDSNTKIAADVNGDTDIDMNDVLYTQRYIAKIIETFPATDNDGNLTTELLYQGHASLRITSKDGVVIYIDPYVGEGYDSPADIILVTHQHSDHNKISLVTQKQDCTIITNNEALQGGKHNSFSIKGIEIEAVVASNKNHSPLSCVGYIITVDGIKIYVAGDTSQTDQVEELSEKELDYALLPCDGIYNMDAKEAAECAEIIGAKHNIPIHTKLGVLFDREIAELFEAPNRLIVEAGKKIVLEK